MIKSSSNKRDSASSIPHSCKKIAIIGAGTLGLTLAYRLSKACHSVTVFEKDSQVGGLSTWFDYGDFIWDRFYHVILPTDSHLLRLIDELGISSKLCWTKTTTGFLWNGQVFSMSNGWEFLKFPLLSLVEKIRLVTGIFYCSKIKNTSALSDITAHDWIPRIFGSRVYDLIWGPLLQSKFGVLSNRVPASFMLSTIKRYYSSRTNRGAGREKMGYTNGGLKTLFESLKKAILVNRGTVRCNEPVISVKDSSSGNVTLLTTRQKLDFDYVFSTIPTTLFKNISKDLTNISESKQAYPEVLGVVCLVLVLRKPLSPFYITNLIQRGFSFTGIIEITNVVKTEQMAGKPLVFLPRYDTSESVWFQMDDREIEDRFLLEIKSVWSDIRQNVIRSFIHRKRYVQPLWVPGSQPRTSPVQNVFGSVFSINGEMIGWDTINNNAAVRLAEKALHSIDSGVQFC